MDAIDFGIGLGFVILAVGVGGAAWRGRTRTSDMSPSLLSMLARYGIQKDEFTGELLAERSGEDAGRTAAKRGAPRFGWNPYDAVKGMRGGFAYHHSLSSEEVESTRERLSTIWHNAFNRGYDDERGAQ